MEASASAWALKRNGCPGEKTSPSVGEVISYSKKGGGPPATCTKTAFEVTVAPQLLTACAVRRGAGPMNRGTTVHQVSYGGLVTMLIRFVSAKNLTSLSPQVASNASALTRMYIFATNDRPLCGYVILMDGEAVDSVRALSLRL